MGMGTEGPLKGGRGTEVEVVSANVERLSGAGPGDAEMRCRDVTQLWAGDVGWSLLAPLIVKKREKNHACRRRHADCHGGRSGVRRHHKQTRTQQHASTHVPLRATARRALLTDECTCAHGAGSIGSTHSSSRAARNSASAALDLAAGGTAAAAGRAATAAGTASTAAGRASTAGTIFGAGVLDGASCPICLWSTGGGREPPSACITRACSLMLTPCATAATAARSASPFAAAAWRRRASFRSSKSSRAASRIASCSLASSAARSACAAPRAGLCSTAQEAHGAGAKLRLLPSRAAVGPTASTRAPACANR
eukprot:scaffold31270_cov112-Isochrysis_galbana.AAC.2